jgi:glycosyltransferase involved in cell wall biosynthesis
MMLRRSKIVMADIVHDVQTYDTRRSSESILQASAKHIAAYNTIYKQFSYLFVHDRSNRESFLNLYDVEPDRVFEIPHGTNELFLEIEPAYSPEALREKLGVSASEPVILFFGTITKYKGIEDLIRAFPATYQAKPSQLLIAGFPAKDIDAPALVKLSEELGVAEHIIWFMDYVPNDWIAPMLALSDVVVLPYRAITQSGVLQIAYACGKPVVVTRVGGLPDIVEDGKSGFLADPENPASLAEAITDILSDSEKLQQMGVYARQLADTRFSWANVASIMKNAFESVPPALE